MRQILAIVIGIACGFIGAASDLRTYEDITIGLLGYLVSILTFVNADLAKLSHLPALRDELTRLAVSLRAQNAELSCPDASSDVFWAVSLRRAQQGRYQLIDSETFAIDKPQIPAFWQQMITNTDHSWSGTDQLLSDRMWIHGWSKHGLELQRACIAAYGVAVRRIFIFEKAAEATTSPIVGIMAEHRRYSVGVRWTTFDSRLQWSPLQLFKAKIGTVDFTILDGKYLFAFNMHGRTLESVKCFSNASLVAEIKAHYERLWDESNPLEEPLAIEHSRLP